MGRGDRCGKISGWLAARGGFMISGSTALRGRWRAGANEHTVSSASDPAFGFLQGSGSPPGDTGLQTPVDESERTTTAR